MDPEVWTPPLTPKGAYLFDCFKRYILVDGPRLSGKSISVDHKLCRHLWEVRFAKVGIICKTLKQGKIGVWDDLTGWIIQTWIEAGMGFRYTQPPKMEADTKMSSFRIRNYYGGESICQLHSLEHDQDVELKFKDSRFSMIYLVEGDKFKDRVVFTNLRTQLRALGVEEKDFQFIIDCNPPEEGEDHFLHDIFLKRLGNNHRDKGVDPKFDEKFERIQMLLEDNTFISPERIEEQTEAYKYDQNLYERWREGKWVKHTAHGHFQDIYVPAIHVHGNTHSMNPEEWDVLVPGSTCMELYTGWDTGDTNHAAVIAAKRETPETTCFDMIDELVILERAISIEDFVGLFLTDHMDHWEDFLLQRYGTKKIRWRHWSDLTAWKYNAPADNYVYAIIQQVSQNRIILNQASKLPGSVAQRLSLLKNLTFQNRIAVSAQLQYTQAMYRNLKRGTLKTELIDPNAKEKHVFDAWTYMLANESPMDMERRVMPVTARTLISMRA